MQEDGQNTVERFFWQEAAYCRRRGDIQTVQDLIFWEYAQLIAHRALGDGFSFRFAMRQFQRLKDGEIRMSRIERENEMLIKGTPKCAYCGVQDLPLEKEHIIPKARGGPDRTDNIVLACKKCNGQKGQRCPLEWRGLNRRDEISRVVWGKYLKLIYDHHKIAGTLDSSDLDYDGSSFNFILSLLWRKKRPRSKAA